MQFQLRRKDNSPPSGIAGGEKLASRWPFIVAAMAVAGISAALVVWATRWGLGISHDSVAYLSAANHLRASLGGDLEERLRHYPPLLPIVLAIPRIWDGSTVDWARWLHVALIVINSVLCGALVLRTSCAGADRGASGTRASAALAAMGLIAVFRDSVVTHSYLWSEPLYLCLLLGLLHALYTHFNAGQRWWSLSIAAACAGLASVTRYAGASAIIAGVVSILLLSAAPKPWLRAIVFGMAASLLPAAWALYNLLTVGDVANRAIQFHPPDSFQFNGLMQTLAGWFVPRDTPVALAILLGIAALAAGGTLIRHFLAGTQHPSSIVREQNAPSESASWSVMPRMLAVFSVVYVLFVLVSISFIDERTPLDFRIALPVFIMLATAALITAGRLRQSETSRPISARSTIACFVFVLIAIHLNSTVI